MRAHTSKTFKRSFVPHTKEDSASFQSLPMHQKFKGLFTAKQNKRFGVSDVPISNKIQKAIDS